MREATFQSKLKKELKERFPECIVYKTDARQIQGSPDLLILNGSKWAALEVKNKATAKHRPNQDYRVEAMNKMSYASFVYPENKEEVLCDLERLFQTT